MKSIFILLIATMLSLHIHGQSMTTGRIGEILSSETDTLQGSSGSWQFKYHDRLMLLITDDTYNRMRIMTPIHMSDQLDQDELTNALIANFHSALDVRYAISEGVMWSVFIHPLRELTSAQLRDALSQVFQAAETFGTTYSSTDLVFPGAEEEPKLNQKPGKKKRM